MNRSMILGLLLVSLAPSLFAAEPAMFDKTKTYCFGRYLVDIPTEAVLQAQGHTYQGAKIETEKMAPAVFQARIDQKIKDLKERTYGAHYYQLNKEIKVENSAVILLGYKEAFGDPMYRIDSFKWNRGVAFITAKDANDNKKIDILVDRYRTYLQNLRFRAEREIPAEPGFCIENGFIANDGRTPQVEHATLAFQLKKHPDVWVSISSDVYFKQEKPLLQRIKDSGVDEKYPGKNHVLSAQGRVINGMSGQESLDEFPSDDQTGVAHSLVWETLGEVANPLKASIQLNISSGEGVAGVTGVSSMSTKEIKALYETIVKTIRIRPTGADKTSDAAPDTPKAPARLPLGSKVANGRPCPEAGLWQCVHPQASPRQVTLKVGQLMPSVLVPNPRSLWQRLKGAPAELAIDSEWTLLQYS